MEDERAGPDPRHSKILVTGATGNVGRLVVNHLLANGATNVRALTNNPRKASLPREVEVVEGYLGRVETMPAALAGVERMYLAPLPQTVRDVLALAKEAGVGYVVDLSASEADTEAAGDPSQWHYYAVEKAVEESGIPWTHLRPGEFMNNYQMWAEQIRASGVVREGYANAANAPIDLDDIAAVAARVLLEDGHIGKKYLMTGPETITRAEMARQIGVAIGRDVRYEELPHDEALEALRPVMGEWAGWYLDGMADLVANPQRAEPTVAALTGRPGTTFAEWAARNASAFV
jgi:uncharacterized protein YbjT (DUF2867 family)